MFLLEPAVMVMMTGDLRNLNFCQHILPSYYRYFSPDVGSLVWTSLKFTNFIVSGIFLILATPSYILMSCPENNRLLSTGSKYLSSERNILHQHQFIDSYSQPLLFYILEEKIAHSHLMWQETWFCCFVYPQLMVYLCIKLTHSIFSYLFCATTIF